MPSVFYELDTNNRGRCLGVELVAQEDSRPTAHEVRDRTGQPASSQSPEVRWLTSSTGRGASRGGRRAEFPRSSVTAWEAAVTHPRHQLAAVDDEDTDDGVEANARLTGMTALVPLVLLAAEGYTILRVRAHLTLHVVIGMILVPPVLLKIGSTSWRFARYYLGSPAYRQKGPPPVLLRLLGPIVVVLTLAVLGSGIALLLGPSSLRQELLLVHKATFILWLGAMAIHVLGHFVETMQLVPKDFYRRTRRQVRGAGKRQWALVGSLCIGVLLAVAVAPKVGPWISEGQHGQPGQVTVVHPLSTATGAPSGS
jgi:hypothetical protein